MRCQSECQSKRQHNGQRGGLALHKSRHGEHASNVPQSAAAFEQLMLDAGLPAGAFQNLYANRHHIEMIINDPRVQGVALTGSEGAGSVVAGQAGKALKKATLELGGADAFIVLDDAEMEKTVKWAVFGRHWNGGQVCVSSKRMDAQGRSRVKKLAAINRR